MAEMVPDRKDMEQRDALQESWLQGRPSCICCGERIQEETAHLIAGNYWCDRCLEDTVVYIED